MAYSAQQIVFLACQILNIPGRTAQVGQFLNMILEEYAQTLDLDSIRKTTIINISPQNVIPFFYPLPTDYLRMYDVFYNVQGTVYTPTQFELKDLDAAYTASGIANYPTKWATDISQNPESTAVTAPSIAFYPPPAVPIAVNCRYRPLVGAIANPETSAQIPYFPNQRILLKDLCVDAAMLADDSRGQNWESEVDRRMRKYLIMDDDKEGYSQTVKLDPNTFRTNVNLPPSKKLGF